MEMGRDVTPNTYSGRDEEGRPSAVAGRIARDALYAEGISPARRDFDRRFVGALERLAHLINDRWLLILNAANAVVFLGAFAVPYLAYLGLDSVASPLFAAYRIICVQNPDHSYFILGHQMAMDQRMTAIFGATVLAGLAFGLVRRRTPRLSWRLYLLLILPMAVDGFTQLFGWRHSNWELRTLTGGLFGAATVWLAYPYLEAVARRASQNRAETRG